MDLPSTDTISEAHLQRLKQAVYDLLKPVSTSIAERTSTNFTIYNVIPPGVQLISLDVLQPWQEFDRSSTRQILIEALRSTIMDQGLNPTQVWPVIKEQFGLLEVKLLDGEKRVVGFYISR